MEFVNLTPHDVTVAGRLFPASGRIARCPRVDVWSGKLEGITVRRTVFAPAELEDKDGNLIGPFPAPVPGAVLIVSALVAESLRGKDRVDVVSPGDPIRDERGRVIGARDFVLAPA